MVRGFKQLLVGTVLTAALCGSAHAEYELRAYAGANWNFDSKVKVNKGAVSDSRNVGWEGKPFAFPPYWGVRGGYWFKDSPWGVALDYTHQKAYAKIDFGADATYDHLEFTDGNNILTLNAMYRLKQKGNPWVFYAGGGPGIAFPHSEVDLDAYPGQTTREYQLTGFAAQVLVGAEYQFNQHWGAFGEGKLSYTQNETDLVGGGTLKTDIWSPHLLAGVAYHF